MVSKKKIKSLIDEASVGYQKCWNILSAIASRDGSDDFLINLLEFQPHLHSILLRLSIEYQLINEEKRLLVESKTEYSPSWFSFRMKCLSNYQTIIERGIYVGKSLGNMYAWIFYDNSRGLLFEHLNHQENTILPFGIGGVGELEFIKNIKFIGRFLVISHEITTFLRLGDVSLYDPITGRIAAIGEIKSRKKSDNEIGITILFCSYDKTFKGELENILVKGSSEVSQSKYMDLKSLPPKMRDRLFRQIAKIQNSIEKSNNINDISREGYFEIYLNELLQLYDSAKTSRVEYMRIGDGLLLIGYKSRKQCLFSKLKINTETDDELNGLSDQVRTIIDSTKMSNQLYTSPFFYTRIGKPYTLSGYVPIAWWPIPLDLVRKLIFQDFLVFTIYNPASLINKLEKRGYKCEQRLNSDQYSISKDVNGSNLILNNLGYFILLLQRGLLKEESIIRIIEDSREVIDWESNKGSRIDYNFTF